MPTYAPEYDIVASFERSMGGAQRAQTPCIAGNVTPSPTPSKMRTRMNTQSGNFFATMGVTTVSTAVPNTPTPKTHFPPNFVASQPPSTWVNMYL